MSERTKGPFSPFLPMSETKNSWQYTTIYDANGTPVARLDLEDWGVTEDNQDTLEDMQARMVKYIIDACNAHDDLVKALEKIAAIEDQEYGSDWAEIEEARGIANAALTKVKES